VRETFINIDENIKSVLKSYFIASLVILVLDLVDLIIQLIRFGRPGDEYSTIVMLGLTMIFWVLNSYYFLWAYQLKFKFPSYI